MMVYWSEGSTSIVISQISASDIIQEEILFWGVIHVFQIWKEKERETYSLLK